MEVEALKHTRQLDYKMQQKQKEFENMLQRVKIKQEMALKLREIKNARPTAVPVVQEKGYIPKLPNITYQDCFCTALNQLANSMQGG